MRLHVDSVWWVRSVIGMRIACPLNLAFALWCGFFDIEHGVAALAALCFFCAGVTLVLGFINWFVYEL